MIRSPADRSLLFPPPHVHARCGDVPLATYGFTPVLQGPPTLVEPLSVQAGNPADLKKISLKKSGDLHSNFIGVNVARMPRSAASEYLPLEPIHLIDGDPQTCWSSMSHPRSNCYPAWVRIDLVREQEIDCIILKKRIPREARPSLPSAAPKSVWIDAGAAEVGRAMPGRLEVKLATDGMTWHCVFDGPTGDTPEVHELSIAVGGRRAKQIWIIGHDLPRCENYLHAFSIAEIEILDRRGRNIALAGNGTGITASSTLHGFSAERDAYHWYWPMHYDLGIKWMRVGFHDDAINWHWVEREKGKFWVDPESIAAIEDMAANDVCVVLALGFGNRLYSGPERRLPQLWEWYWDNPAPPKGPEQLEAWGRYVRHMTRTLRDSVGVWEIWNEWNGGCYWGDVPDPAVYVAVARKAIGIVKQECPGKPIMLGSFAGFTFGISTWDQAELAKQEREHPLMIAVADLAGEVDVIAWHPNYQRDPDDPHYRSYVADCRTFMSWCRDRGFRGSFMVTEWGYGASYPAPMPGNWWGPYQCSEIQKAKLIAQITMRHAGLGLPSFFCTSLDNQYPLDLSLLRRAFPADPITPLQPQAAYYVMRNLAVATDGLTPAAVQHHCDPADPLIESFSFAGRSDETVIAVWRGGQPADDCTGESRTLTIDQRFAKAIAIDSLNGVEQDLTMTAAGDATRIHNILIRDYPILIRLQP